MNKIITFFRTFWLTLTEPKFYNDVKRADFSFSLKYFLVFNFLISFIFALILLIFVNFKIVPKVGVFVDELVNNFPDELQVAYDVDSQTLTTRGVDEPVRIELPETISLNDYQNLVVIDTDLQTESILNMNTLILMTDSNLSFIYDLSGDFYIVSYDQLLDVFANYDQGHQITSISIDKSFIESNSAMIKIVVTDILMNLPVVLLFGFFIFLVISRLILLLVLTVFVYFISLILSRGMTYFKTYQLGLHTITVVDLITKISFLMFRSNANNYFSMAFIGVSTIALLGIKPKSKT